MGGQESGGGEWSGVKGGRVMEDGEWRMMSLSREMARTLDVLMPGVPISPAGAGWAVLEKVLVSWA